MLRRYAESGEEVQWWYVSKRLTFSAAMRAALGDELSRQDMDELFPIATGMGQGVFSPVCPLRYPVLAAATAAVPVQRLMHC